MKLTSSAMFKHLYGLVPSLTLVGSHTIGFIKSLLGSPVTANVVNISTYALKQIFKKKTIKINQPIHKYHSFDGFKFFGFLINFTCQYRLKYVINVIGMASTFRMFASKDKSGHIHNI